MRIISGRFKGRRFHPPAGKWPTRPTTDIGREGLYNILANLLDFEVIRCLDLFGGTGSHAFESISRGCQAVTYVDRHEPCIRFVRGMARELAIEPCVRIIRDDVFRFLSSCSERFDYIFADPPYGLPRVGTLPDLLIEHGLLEEDGLFVLEHAGIHRFGEHPHFLQERRYGETWFSFFHSGKGKKG